MHPLKHRRKRLPIARNLQPHVMIVVETRATETPKTMPDYTRLTCINAQPLSRVRILQCDVSTGSRTNIRSTHQEACHEHQITDPVALGSRQI